MKINKLDRSSIPHSSKLLRRFSSLFGGCAILLLCSGASGGAAADKPGPSGASVEASLLSALQAGEVADAGQTEVSTDFVVGLLLHSEKTLPNGVRIQNARFRSRLDLSSFRVTKSLWLVGCQFDDGIDLTGTRFEGDLSLAQSQFAYPAGEHDSNDSFIGLKVMGDTDLTGVVFAGPANFTYAEFRGEFMADGAVFQAPETSADFQFAQFRGDAFFRESGFSGILRMSGAQLQDTNFALVPLGKTLEIPGIDMSQAIVQRSFVVQGGQLDYLGLSSLRALGTANLEPFCVSQQIDLRKASFDTLSFNVLPCQEKTKFLSYVSGLRYTFITSDNGGPPTDSFLNVLAASNSKGTPNESNNSPDPGVSAQYAQYEAFLRAHNYDDDADRVLLAGKRWERVTASSGWFSLSRWKGNIEDWTVGYGTKPLRPLFLCILVVVLGTLVLNKPQLMDFTDDKAPRQKFSAFWFALDKFAPIIDLRVADLWQPRTAWLQRCALALRILGFILVPLAVAAIAGSFK
ncbi:MAG TPA: hypothetical protein VEI73_08390 [Candidatus Acidoferrum sp.]|nr:hypothetical protein [Candidatus Acidoferrum sp.]